MPVDNEGDNQAEEYFENSRGKNENQSVDQGMQGNSVSKKFFVIIKAYEGTAQIGKAEYYFMEAEKERIENRVEGKSDDKKKARYQ